MKVHDVEQFVVEVTLIDVLHHVLQLLRNSRIYSDECNLQSCTYSADHRVQGKALETASRSPALRLNAGQCEANFLHTLFTLFC